MAITRPLLGLLLVALVACEEKSGIQAKVATEGGTCVDEDNDGFGRYCTAGPDCDDRSADVHEGCTRCATPAAACACEPGTEAQSCYLDVTEQDGQILCHEGTRYCRDGLWSECEGVFSYELPEERRAAALLSADAGVTSCNACNPVCYRLSDTLDPTLGVLGDIDDTLDWSSGGGLTLAADPDQTATGTTPTDPATCVPGSEPDTDCDGIPDSFDPYPTTPPFATNNTALFLEMGPGETDSGDIGIEFALNSADVYFLVDQSGSMQAERDQLVADITSGTFITDSAYECADIDNDGSPNNELKGGGIIGAIRCVIRDSNFGVGLFRELPFSPKYANSQQLAFEHYQDITDDADAVRSAVNRLWIEGNNEWPESGAIALHSVVTGEGMYLGTRLPGVPSRTDCPEGRWGYPCFRQSAVPIVMLFTDAQHHNGPPSLSEPFDNAYAYPATFAIRESSNAADRDYRSVDSSNEVFSSAYSLGDVTSRLLTVQGTTADMNSDYSRSVVTCASEWYGDAAPDAVVRFSVAESKTISLSTIGSAFDTVLGLYQFSTPSLQTLTASTNNNETAATAQSLGSVSGANKRISGSTSSMQANYLGSTLGCSADASSPDAVYSFTASSDTTVTLSTSGSSLDSVIALYDSPPLTTTYTPNASNTNDRFDGAYDLGDIYADVAAVSGSTASAGLNADYSAGDLGCTSSDLATDVTYRFSLSQPTRVQLSTEGSTVDTTVALLSDQCSSGSCALVGGFQATLPRSAENFGSAYDVGDLAGVSATLKGDTSAMVSNVTNLSCGAVNNGVDVVARFELSTAAEVTLDASATGFDAVLGVVRADDTEFSQVVASNSNEDAGSAQDLGTINGKWVRVDGGDTGGMTSDYDSEQMSCGTATAGSGDAVYRFHLDNPTRVRIDTTGSSFDTVLSLHDGPIRVPSSNTVSTAPSTAERPGNAHDHGTSISSGFHRIDGDSTHMSPDVTFHGTGSDACHLGSDDHGHDAFIRLDVTAAGTYSFTLQSIFESGLALYPGNISPFSVPLIDYGDAGDGPTPDAVDLGLLDDWWVRATGRTWDGNTYFSSCNADGWARETMFDFTLSQNQTLVFNSNDTAYNSTLLLYQYTNASHTSTAGIACASGGGTGNDVLFSRSINAGDYLLAITGESWFEGGTYRVEIKDSSLGADNMIQCAGGGVSNSFQTYLSAGTYYAVVKGYRASASGDYSLSVSNSAEVYDPGESYEMTCNNNATGLGTASAIEQTLAAGDYYVVVSGASSAAEGAYRLTVQDVNDPPVADEVGCSDSGSLSLGTLPAGAYYAVIKGADATEKGAFEVKLGQPNVTTAAPLACDEDSADGRAALIERDLAAGTYYVTVKGQAATDAGDYRLAVRDIDNQFVAPLACDADSGNGETSFVEADVTSGKTYYVVVKGDAGTDQGSYQLTVTDQEASTTPTQLACDNNSGSYSGASAITRTLGPGVYYAVVKGYATGLSGDYQLTIGGAAEQDGTYAPPTWQETEAALLERGVKVISILSCHDDPANGDGGACDEIREQSRQMANTTDTLGGNLSPLVFDIDRDGSGLSTNVVDGIVDLSDYLEMDVKVTISWSPDANPGFIATVEAVDAPGDGCSGISGDEHLECRSGAMPQFRVTFENPEDAPVPRNPSDPNGGYNFRALLIGDDSFVMDEVPIYVIPEDVEPDEGDPIYYSSGTYRQDMDSSGCTGNQRPDWRDLSWSAAVPRDTQISFLACTAETSDELESCSLQSVVTIRSEGSCTSDSDCAVGSCDAAVSACQIVSAGSCASDDDCALNATCQSGRCIYDEQPVYVGHELAADNYKSYLRLGIQLSGDEPILDPPVLASWDLTYLCSDVN